MARINRLMRFLAGDLVRFVFLLDLLQKLPVTASVVSMQISSVRLLLDELLFVLAARIDRRCRLRLGITAFHSEI